MAGSPGSGRRARGRVRFRRFGRRSTRRVRIPSFRTCPIWWATGATRSATTRRFALLLATWLQAWTSASNSFSLRMRWRRLDLFGRDGCLRLVEIRWTLLEERRQRFLGLCGVQPLNELLVFGFHRLSERADRSLLDEPLARAQRAVRFCRELLRGRGGGCEQVSVSHHAGHEAQLRRPRGREGLSQQEQFRSPEMADARRQRVARPELRHERQIDERQLEPCALACID